MAYRTPYRTPYREHPIKCPGCSLPEEEFRCDCSGYKQDHCAYCCAFGDSRDVPLPPGWAADRDAGCLAFIMIAFLIITAVYSAL